MSPKRDEEMQKVGKWRRRGAVSPDEEEKIAAWNRWAKRFNVVLAKAFEKTFADFLEMAVRKMYADGWEPEDAAHAFIWGIRQVGYYRPVRIGGMGNESEEG